MRKKKILVSLLLSPLALTAFGYTSELPDAVNSESWKPNSVTGGTGFTITNGTITVLEGTTTLSQTLTIPKPGVYKISLENPNNCKLEISGATSEDDVFTVQTTKANETVELKVVYEKASMMYSFTGVKVEFDFDFETYYANYTAALDDLNLTKVTAEDNSATATSLKKQYDKLTAQIAKVKADVENINPGSIDAYGTYKFYNDPNVLETEINDLKTDVAAYNAAAAKENAAYVNHVANEAKMNALLDEVSDLQAQLDAATESYNYSDGAKKAYVEGKVKKEAESIQTDINDYTEEIKEAYSDLNKTGIIPPTSKVNLIENEIDDLNYAITNAAQAYDNYKEYTAAYNALKNAYLQTLNDLEGLTGVEGYEDVYNEYAAKKQAEALALYNGITPIDNTDAALEGWTEEYKANIEEATTKLTAIGTDAKALAKEQNQLFTAAMAEVDDIEVPELPENEDGKKACQSYYDKVNKLIDALKNQIESDYEAHNVGDYSAKLAEINSAIEAYKAELQKWTSYDETVGNLQAKADELTEEITALKKTISGYDLTSKFVNNFALLEQAVADINTQIGKLTTDNYQDNTASIEEQIKNISEQIKNAGENAKTLYDAIVDVEKDLKAFEEEIGKVNGYVNGKTYVEGVTNPDATTFTKALSDKLAEFKSDFTDAKAADYQECYYLYTKLKATIVAYGYEAQVLDVLKSFESEYTQNNIDAAQALIDSSKDEMGSDYYGYDADAYTELETLLAEYQTALDTAKELDAALTDKYVKNFGDIDENVKTLIADVKAKAEEIQKLIDNQNAYNTLLGSLNDLQSKIDALTEFNKENSNAPATDYYAGVIAGYQEELDDIKATLDEALTNKEVVSKQTAINEKIKDLSSKVDGTESAIRANETAHNAQLIESNRVLGVINSAIAHINDTVGENVLGDEQQAKVDQWIKALESLRDKDLIDVDRNSYKAFGNGESDAQNADIIAAYDKIAKDASDIQTAFDGKFGNLISSTNTATVNSIGWDNLLAGLNEEYAKAINAYNAYYGLTDADFKAAMIEVVGNHAAIFDYIQKITALKARATDWVVAKNADKKTFSVDEFKAAFVNEGGSEDKPTSEDLLNGMKNDVQKMQEAAIDEATNYYNTALEQANTVYNNAVNALTSTGLFTLDEAKAALDEATTNLKNGTITLPTEWEEAFEAAKAVDNALSSLKAVPGSINLQTVAKNKWNTEYNNAKALTDLLAQLNKLPYGDKTSAETIIKNCLKKAGNLNNQATTDGNLIENLKDLVDQYKNLVAQAQYAYDAAKTASDNASADQALDDEYTGYITNFRSQLDELNEYAEGLISDNATTIAGVEAQIDAFESFIKDNRSNLSAVKDQLESKKKAIKNGLTSAYTTIVNNEQAKINKLIADVKVSYNNAKTIGSTLDLDAYYNDIQEAIATAGNIFTTWGQNGDNLAYKTAAIALEKTLSEIYVALEGSYTHDNVGGLDINTITADLNAQYDEVNDEIKALNSYLASCDESVQQEFSLDELTAALEAVKTAWEDEGDRLIMTYGNFQAQMEGISKDVADKKAEIEAAQAAAEVEKAKVEANNAAYDTLNDELDGYKSQLEELKTKAEEYGVTASLTSAFNSVTSLIDNAQTALDAANKAVSLTKDSKLANVDEITSNLAMLTYNVSVNYAINKLTEVKNSISTTEAALSGHIVGLDDLKTEFDGYKEHYTGLDNDRKDAVQQFFDGGCTQDAANTAAEDLDQVAAEAIALLEKLNEFKDKVEENRYVPGHVTGAGSNVNISDVQKIIDWVGEGVDLDNFEAKGLTAKQFAAADLDGNNVINIADVTQIINMVLNQNAEPNQMRLMSRRAMRKSDSMMNIVNMGTADGITTYAITLSNTETLVAGQFDINLDGDIAIVGMSMGERASEHDLYQFDNAEITRVLVVSMENAAIADNDGAVVYLQVSGSGSISIDNAIFAEGTGAAVEVKTNANTSLIDSIYEGMREVKDKVYNVAGQALRSLQRGINIVRKSDGTTTKELHK